METINWKVEGMSCSTCALTIGKYLEKKGLQNVRVSLATGDVSFDTNEAIDGGQLQKDIRDLGYTVISQRAGDAAPVRRGLNKHLRYFLFCLPFTILLLLHMLPGGSSLHWLMHPWIQLLLCLPVFITGMLFFGRSAVRSLLNRSPNMNVLIAVGSTAAFLYSLAGTLFRLGPEYLFYETTASIITIVFLGYYLEDASVQTTQRSLGSLIDTQKTMANMIAFDDKHQEVLFPVENTQLRSGDLILVRSGERVPADCKVLWGEATTDESILTGESLPVDKKAKDMLIGGSLLVSGTVKAQVTAASADSVLAGIVRMVTQAQGERPPIQRLADRISAVFVPVVLGLAVLTFLGNDAYSHQTGQALMRSVAVLVIACPCAMGLATPAAIAVGLGRGARKGILFRNARHLEAFRTIRQVVFDKTGTLTTGEFSISGWQVQPGVDEDLFRGIAVSLEKYSGHPIARSITREWKDAPTARQHAPLRQEGQPAPLHQEGQHAPLRQESQPAPLHQESQHAPLRKESQPAPLRWEKVEEVKGKGMRGVTKAGDEYWAGSYAVAAGLTDDDKHNVYIVANGRLLGSIDVADSIRPEAAAVVQWLQKKGIHTVLLSGDRRQPAVRVAEALGIGEVLAEQTPEQKLRQVTRLTDAMPTAMVGDGINDAPALARATIGLSMSEAAQLAVETADVVLMNHGLRLLPEALGLGRHTYSTIRGNLFWAFFYNILAIPVAALGWLTPAVAALVMGLSDVILVLNSLRLYITKVDR